MVSTIAEQPSKLNQGVIVGFLNENESRRQPRPDLASPSHGAGPMVPVCPSGFLFRRLRLWIHLTGTAYTGLHSGPHGREHGRFVRTHYSRLPQHMAAIRRSIISRASWVNIYQFKAMGRRHSPPNKARYSADFCGFTAGGDLDPQGSMS